jgi:hypothetical protein
MNQRDRARLEDGLRHLLYAEHNFGYGREGGGNKGAEFDRGMELVLKECVNRIALDGTRNFDAFIEGVIDGAKSIGRCVSEAGERSVISQAAKMAECHL